MVGDALVAVYSRDPGVGASVAPGVSVSAEAPRQLEVEGIEVDAADTLDTTPPPAGERPRTRLRLWAASTPTRRWLAVRIGSSIAADALFLRGFTFVTVGSVLVRMTPCAGWFLGATVGIVVGAPAPSPRPCGAPGPIKSRRFTAGANTVFGGGKRTGKVGWATRSKPGTKPGSGPSDPTEALAPSVSPGRSLTVKQPLWPRGEKCAVRPKKKIDIWLHRIQKSIEFAVRIYLLLRGGPGG